MSSDTLTMTKWDTKTNVMKSNSSLSQPYGDHFTVPTGKSRKMPRDLSGLWHPGVLDLGTFFQQALMMESQDPCQVAEGGRGDVLAAGYGWGQMELTCCRELRN